MKTERKRNAKGLTLAIAASLTLLASCFEAIDQETPLNSEVVVLPEFRSEYIQGEYIVELYPTVINFRKSDKYEDVQASMRKFSSELLLSHKISPENLEMVYGHAMDGFSVKLSDKEFEAIRNDPRVRHIEQDQVIILAKPDHAGGGSRG